MSDVLDVFTRQPDDQPPPVLKGVSIRMPAGLLRYIDEMAEQADMSRNGMSVQLLEWGVRYALGELPDEIRDQIVEAVEGPDGVAFFYDMNHN